MVTRLGRVSQVLCEERSQKRSSKGFTKETFVTWATDAARVTLEKARAWRARALRIRPPEA